MKPRFPPSYSKLDVSGHKLRDSEYGNMSFGCPQQTQSKHSWDSQVDSSLNLANCRHRSILSEVCQNTNVRGNSRKVEGIFLGKVVVQRKDIPKPQSNMYFNPVPVHLQKCKTQDTSQATFEHLNTKMSHQIKQQMLHKKASHGNLLINPQNLMSSNKSLGLDSQQIQPFDISNEYNTKNLKNYIVYLERIIERQNSTNSQLKQQLRECHEKLHILESQNIKLHKRVTHWERIHLDHFVEDDKEVECQTADQTSNTFEYVSPMKKYGVPPLSMSPLQNSCQ